MLKNALRLSLAFGVIGCVTPQRASSPGSAGSGPDGKEIAQLKDALARLDNRLGHLESEVSAASAEGELTAMTIDSVKWSDRDQSVASVFGSGPTLLCHVVEWRGYGKMLRFVRQADPVFTLEAEGHPSVKATMATGGICDSDGSTRLAVLKLSGSLDPNTQYRLHPRNENEPYRWSMPNDLAVFVLDPAR